MSTIRSLELALFVLLSGCGGPPASQPFTPVADVKQLMASVLEPAADVYWDAVGTIDDAKGSVEFAPSSDDEWTAVRSSAYIIAESGNLLMMGNRAMDGGEWMKMSQGLIEAGRRALMAAEARDKAAVFDAGAEVYEACTRCHAVYAVQLQRPNAGKE
jgi:hypothetical protein